MTPGAPRVLQAATLAPGHRIGGRYEIVRVLGVGGSSVVYAARDLEVGDEIALKVLRPDRLSEILVERSKREVGIARGIDDPRLVRIFSWIEHDGAICLPMELVEGGTLRDRLADGPLPADEAIAFAVEILEALAVLHKHEVVHRDVKPGNLLLTREGRIKLSDFGIARKWTRDESALTRSDVTLGTIDYLSPEQAAGKTAGPPSDLYSFGIVLYEMLTGVVPFRRDSAVASIVARLQETAPDVREVRTDVQPWLAAIVSRLLARDAALRYATADDVLADLRARRATAVRRWRTRAAAVVAALIALATAAVPLVRTFSTPATLPQLVADGDRGVKALDEKGGLLWSRKDVGNLTQIAAVRRGRVREYATVLTSQQTQEGPALRTLSFLDPWNGSVLRHVQLPEAGGSFPQLANRFGLDRVMAVDIDGDGYDEVLVSYGHVLSWPSFTVMHELRNGASRVLFIASGHHRPELAVDLDGDGRKEVIFGGVNNLMGWHQAVAAVRVERDGSTSFAASTPDAMYSQSPHDTLLWYALTPAGRMPDTQRLEVDEGARRLRMRYLTREPFDLTYHGFPQGRPGAKVRNDERRASYAHLREARRLSDGGFGNEAAAEGLLGRQSAERAGDAMLIEWADRVRGMSFMRAGRLAEGEALFNAVAALPEATADVSYDAAKALHLAGEPARASAWYRRGLGRDAKLLVGRLKWEYLHGLVMSLGELGRWDEALQEAARYRFSYPEQTKLVAWYEAYIQWRSGGAPAPLPATASDQDLHRYWALELRLAHGEAPAALLAELPAERARSSETGILLLSLEGELLSRLGRNDEALRVARDADTKARVAALNDTTVRGHAALIHERYERIRRKSDAVSGRASQG